MGNTSERPVCHRAEDLVTYLYGEANAEEARDFAHHLQQCAACQAEFTLFNQVRESIVAWRSEALGSLPPQREVSATVTPAVVAGSDLVQHDRKLSAGAALREFFSVSPLWLRGATAFAGLLLCALLVFAVSRFWRQPNNQANDNNPSTINQQQFDLAVQKAVDERLAALARKQNEEPIPPAVPPRDERPARVASSRSRRKIQPARLTREEREQLAADLGLVPGREEDLPFVLPDEPNQ